jgi:uncharacterized protein (DUF433 family)
MNRDELLDRISNAPNVCFGRTCIRGHRVWVSLVLDFLASGVSVQEARVEYGIEEADVLACIAYGAEMARFADPPVSPDGSPPFFGRFTRASCGPRGGTAGRRARLRNRKRTGERPVLKADRFLGPPEGVSIQRTCQTSRHRGSATPPGVFPRSRRRASPMLFMCESSIFWRPTLMVA